MSKIKSLEFGQPLVLEIAEEHELEYKKSYMHMYNKFAYDAGAITKEIFKKTEVFIDNLKK